MNRVVAGVAICGIALLSFFLFPGHTWLQQDTQIYVPILEHLQHPQAFQRDLLVQYPHVSFTLYDEAAIALRRVTGLGFEPVLGGLQLVCRAFGIWGVYLLALSAGLDSWAALFVAAAFSLGASIAGPQVLTFEYEPTPRAFALPLVFCAMGLVSRKRFTWAGIAAGVAFVIHAPTTLPFWLAMCWITWRVRRQALPVWIAWLCAMAVLAVAVVLQTGPRDNQEFFAHLTGAQESVQRMRAAYNWISSWPAGVVAQHFVLYAIGLAAWWRVRRWLNAEFQTFALMLPAIGILSMPISYLFLEKVRWALIPQLQPVRTLLFISAFAVILGSIAAIRASHILESAAWFALVFFIPMRVELFAVPSLRVVLVALTLAAIAIACTRLPRPALLAVGAVAFFAIPIFGHVRNYPDLHTPEVRELALWARENTAPEAMFLFPDAGKNLASGIFRVEACRAVYADWKSGGQVNYLKEFADEWRVRWELIDEIGFTDDAIPRYRSMGIQYLVLRPGHVFTTLEPVYHNALYAVYRIAG
jgi:hypothetical protein